VVQKVAEAAGAQQRNGVGIAVHYGLGMGPGALYTHRRRQYPWLRTGRGALYGLGFAKD
jgi:hypothetical protein